MERTELRRARPGDEVLLSSELAFRAKASNGHDDAFMEARRAEPTFSADDLTDVTVAESDGSLVGMVGLDWTSGARRRSGTPSGVCATQSIGGPGSPVQDDCEASMTMAGR